MKTAMSTAALVLLTTASLLAQEPDRSYTPPRVEQPQVESDRPLVEVRDLQITFRTPAGDRTALTGVSLAAAA